MSDNGATKFFVEAKTPSVALDDINHILQAKICAWLTKSRTERVISVSM